MADDPGPLLTEIALSRLNKMFGAAKGQVLLDEAIARAKLAQIQTADDLKKVAQDLIGKGGLIKMIGHSVMVEALLRGAKMG